MTRRSIRERPRQPRTSETGVSFRLRWLQHYFSDYLCAVQPTSITSGGAFPDEAPQFRQLNSDTQLLQILPRASSPPAASDLGNAKQSQANIHTRRASRLSFHRV